MNSGMRSVLPSISTGRSGKRLAEDCGPAAGFPVSPELGVALDLDALVTSSL